MARVTYIGEEPRNGSFSWLGHEFAVGVAVDTDHAQLLRQASANRFFIVEEDGPDTPYERGAKAALDGKKRSIPPAYRGKHEGEQWAAGYDEAAS